MMSSCYMFHTIQTVCILCILHFHLDDEVGYVVAALAEGHVPFELKTKRSLCCHPFRIAPCTYDHTNIGLYTIFDNIYICTRVYDCVCIFD